jgi:hypothetical protein
MMIERMPVKNFPDIALIALFCLKLRHFIQPRPEDSCGCGSGLLLRRSVRRAFLNAVSACKSARVNVPVVFARCLRQIRFPILAVIQELLNRPVTGRTRG